MKSDPVGPADLAADLALGRRARVGDHAAFHELVDRYAPGLLGLAVSLVGNMADAEDIVQETFSGAFRGLRSFRGESSMRTWLTRILVRQTAAFRRKRKRTIDLLQVRSEGAPAEGPSASAAADTRMDVAAAVLALPLEYREVVVLRELQGLSYEEIADVLDIPRGTVDSRLFRARRAMQELLKEYLG